MVCSALAVTLISLILLMNQGVPEFEDTYQRDPSFLDLILHEGTSLYTDETELKLALSAVTIRFIRGIVPLQVHSRVTPAPRHSTPLISIIWNGANRYSVPKRSCGQKKISFRLKNIESGNVQK